MSKLPLVARKNIKENEAKVEEYKEQITAAVELPTEITFNFDYETTSPAVDKAGYQNRIGDVMVWWLQGLEEGFTRQCKNPISKAALQNVWTTGVIRFQLATNKKGESKQASVDIENGDVVVSMYNVSSSSNATSAVTEMIENLNDSESNLRVAAAKNLKEGEEKLAETLQKIQDFFSFSNDVTLSCDYVTFSGKCDADGYKNRVGDVVGWYIEPLADNLTRHFKHEISKAALQAVWTSGVIRFDFATNKKNENFTVKSSIQDNDLVLTYYKSGNSDSAGNDLLEQIEDPASHLPLKSALNVKEEEEKREEYLEKIHTSTGLSADVTVDIDWVAFDAFAAKEGYKFRVGDVLGWYLNSLEDNIMRLCRSEISKNALQAVWTTGVIRFELVTPKKTENRYQSTSVRDGDLVVTIYKNGNTDSTGRDLLEQLQDPELGLPLKSALNIKENEEKRQEVLEKIQEVTGSGTEVTLSSDWTTFDPITTKNGYANRVGDVMQWILDGLKSNMERMCREELTKEAIGEAWTTGVIRFEENKKAASDNACEFVNGDLVIQYKGPEKFGSNSDSCGRDIESKL